jgi:hypothetical protein
MSTLISASDQVYRMQTPSSRFKRMNSVETNLTIEHPSTRLLTSDMHGVLMKSFREYTARFQNLLLRDSTEDEGFTYNLRISTSSMAEGRSHLQHHQPGYRAVAEKIPQLSVEAA